MAAEPDFCRDILETRIKGILKEHLKISRDISFLQVINRRGKMWASVCWWCRSREWTRLRRLTGPNLASSASRPGKTKRTCWDKQSCWKVAASTSRRMSPTRTVSHLSLSLGSPLPGNSCFCFCARLVMFAQVTAWPRQDHAGPARYSMVPVWAQSWAGAEAGCEVVERLLVLVVRVSCLASPLTQLLQRRIYQGDCLCLPSIWFWFWCQDNHSGWSGWNEEGNKNCQQNLHECLLP